MSFLEQLPEVIEQIGRDVKAITVVLGRGRPDKPDTTGDKITGEEPKIKGIRWRWSRSLEMAKTQREMGGDRW